VLTVDGLYKYYSPASIANALKSLLCRPLFKKTTGQSMLAAVKKYEEEQASPPADANSSVSNPVHKVGR
jgi:hypothetical protein